MTEYDVFFGGEDPTTDVMDFQLWKMAEVEAPNPRKAREKAAEVANNNPERMPEAMDGQGVRLFAIPKTHMSSGVYEMKDGELR